ncbi:MAG: glutamine--tRNA ligase/YqeY domain fusion protein [Myxococcota bacterium]
MSDAKAPETAEREAGPDFIRAKVSADLQAGKHQQPVTRFPPEPNGYLHIGHAKAICLGFGIAEEFKGRCHLRFDDTNPAKEDQKYVDSIQEDIRWLGFDWGEHLYFASSYFERLYEYAETLIKDGKAYVDDQSEEEIQRNRGTVKSAGTPSPFRSRSVEENLELFRKMRDGAFEDGAKVLRAKIDMASPNMKMRDPLLYRIRKAHHHQTGDKWCIYPFYDFTHCLSDSIERITHSLCSLEFENNREVYDWILDNLDVPKPQPRQTEFARLNLTFTVMSKRKLLRLVEEGHVKGWDDPRMPTIAGMRRRGYRPQAIRAFCDKVGVARAISVVDKALLESTIRDDLNPDTPRVMAVLKPLKLVITNYPEGETETFDAPRLPDAPERLGSRKVPFSRELWIEATDFMEDPPRKFFRLAVGKEVRLRWAYVVTCTGFTKNDAGEVVEVQCTYDPETRGGNTPDGRRVKGTIHWVSAEHAVDAEVRLYDHLFKVENPGQDDDVDVVDELNEKSVEIVEQAKVEQSLGDAKDGERFQFERTGYFVVDADSTDARPVFNRTVALKDGWAKLMKKTGGR